MTVTKTADVSTFGGAGETITYTYVITNTGNVEITGIAATDDKLGALTLTHDAGAGRRVLVSSGRVQLTAPNYQDMDGIAMLQMGANFIPSSTGNDEIAIAVY